MDSDAEWTTNENTIYGNAAMIFLTAAIRSRIESDPVRGDINADGKCGIADAVLLQKYLLTLETDLPNRKAGDLDQNGTLNAADLTLMKQLLMK